MPAKMFEGSAQDLGRWSSHTELIFHLLDKANNNRSEGDAIPLISRQPHTRGQWSNHARSSHNIRKARLRLEETAKKMFCDTY